MKLRQKWDRQREFWENSRNFAEYKENLRGKTLLTQHAEKLTIRLRTADPHTRIRKSNSTEIAFFESLGKNEKNVVGWRE